MKSVIIDEKSFHTNKIGFELKVNRHFCLQTYPVSRYCFVPRAAELLPVLGPFKRGFQKRSCWYEKGCQSKLANTGFRCQGVWNNSSHFRKFKDGKQSGRASMSYPDGSKYEGEFGDGQRQGSEILALPYGRSAGSKPVNIWGKSEFSLSEGSRICRGVNFRLLPFSASRQDTHPVPGYF
jgi:hypothetical protein